MSDQKTHQHHTKSIPWHQQIQIEFNYIPWASTTVKIMVDPISMIKTLRYAMVVILTPIVLMVVGIPGYNYSWRVFEVFCFVQVIFLPTEVFTVDPWNLPREAQNLSHSHAMQTCRGVLKVRQRQVIRLRQWNGGQLTCLANLAWQENLEKIS